MSKKPFLIGIAGGTCCGKSEVCKRICTELAIDGATTGNIIILGHKSFYREFSEEEKCEAAKGNFNFDHPSAFDDELMVKALQQLKNGEVAKIPKYDYATHSREDYQTIQPADVILFEGILVLYHKAVRELLDMKIFVDTDCDTRLARRVLRDTVEHNRDIDTVLGQYTKFVKHSFEDFTLPTKRYADVIIPRGVDNTVAIQLIVQHLEDIMNVGVKNVRRRTVSESSGGRPH